MYNTRIKYSRWDGTQQITGLDADEIMRALSDDLMQNGDLQRALQRLFRWGFERPDGQQVPGLQELLNRLRQRRQEQLQRYDLGSILDDVQEKLREIVATERAGIERRLNETEGRRDGGTEGPEGGEAGSSGDRSDRPSVPPSLRPDEFRPMLEQIAQRKLEQLDQLPDDPGGAIRALHEYEF